MEVRKGKRVEGRGREGSELMAAMKQDAFIALSV